jgi:hypothetical protein
MMLRICSVVKFGMVQKFKSPDVKIAEKNVFAGARPPH